MSIFAGLSAIDNGLGAEKLPQSKTTPMLKLPQPSVQTFRFADEYGRQVIVLDGKLKFDAEIKETQRHYGLCHHWAMNTYLACGGFVGVTDPFLYRVLQDLWYAAAAIGAALQDGGWFKQCAPAYASLTIPPEKAKDYLLDLVFNNGTPFVLMEKPAEMPMLDIQMGDTTTTVVTEPRYRVTDIAKLAVPAHERPAFDVFSDVYHGREVFVLDAQMVDQNDLAFNLDNEAEKQLADSIWKTIIRGGFLAYTDNDSCLNYYLDIVWGMGMLIGAALQEIDRFKTVMPYEKWGQLDIPEAEVEAYLKDRAHLTIGYYNWNGGNPSVPMFAEAMAVPAKDGGPNLFSYSCPDNISVPTDHMVWVRDVAKNGRYIVDWQRMMREGAPSAEVTKRWTSTIVYEHENMGLDTICIRNRITKTLAERIFHSLKNVS